MNENLTQLIQKCVQNDRASQQQLYQLFAPVLYGICLKYMKNEADAKDVFQEGFVLVFQKMHQFKHQGSFEGWLKRIFINLLIKTLKGAPKNILLLEGYDLADASFEDEALESVPIPQEKLLEYIQDLPDQYRLVFNLYVFEKRKHKEIAQLLHISEGTSKSNLNRAKINLRNRILAALKSKTA
ncbi:sigma-70 family RNA polymerase sigma factor [Flavobacterium restrictum]|uniref:Sigma-70 family RNA polymerase sigma factor n=1 Tax=Flavobacterium restrictum TaxID=2594428 RepID=A0A553E2M6_9FLAO|nr:sigma-70 family RNA polymerase sigma factor [Flavobacterium restrictum]